MYRKLNRSLFIFLNVRDLFFLSESGIIKADKNLTGKVSLMKEWSKYQTFGMVAAAIALCVLMLQVGAPI
jgi:hypothetical protein